MLNGADKFAATDATVTRTRLSRKIESDPAHPDAIRTVRGVGYMFVSPSA
jgi:DNA-binding response OmpR family regulator